MAKYSKYQRKSAPRRQMSPAWRGIGCLLMVIVPALSYWIAHGVLQLAKQRNLVPPDLLGYFHFPDWIWNIPFLNTIAGFLGSLKDVWATLIFFFVILFILSGLVSLIWSFIYQTFGPPRYTELDAVPDKRKAREYKR